MQSNRNNITSESTLEKLRLELSPSEIQEESRFEFGYNTEQGRMLAKAEEEALIMHPQFMMATGGRRVRINTEDKGLEQINEKKFQLNELATVMFEERKSIHNLETELQSLKKNYEKILINKKSLEKTLRKTSKKIMSKLKIEKIMKKEIEERLLFLDDKLAQRFIWKTLDKIYNEIDLSEDERQMFERVESMREELSKIISLEAKISDKELKIGKRKGNLDAILNQYKKLKKELGLEPSLFSRIFNSLPSYESLYGTTKQNLLPPQYEADNLSPQEAILPKLKGESSPNLQDDISLVSIDGIVDTKSNIQQTSIVDNVETITDRFTFSESTLEKLRLELSPSEIQKLALEYGAEIRDLERQREEQEKILVKTRRKIKSILKQPKFIMTAENKKYLKENHNQLYRDYIGSRKRIKKINNYIQDCFDCITEERVKLDSVLKSTSQVINPVKDKVEQTGSEVLYSDISTKKGILKQSKQKTEPTPQRIGNSTFYINKKSVTFSDKVEFKEIPNNKEKDRRKKKWGSMEDRVERRSNWIDVDNIGKNSSKEHISLSHSKLNKTEPTPQRIGNSTFYR